MSYHISDHYIWAGKPDDTDRCPVALAIRDATGLSVSVLSSAIYISISDSACVRYTPSDEVADWIDGYDLWGLRGEDFDDMPPPPPITFTLEDIYVHPTTAE